MSGLSLQENRSLPLSDSQLTLRIVRLALPAIAEMVLNMLTWLVDTAMVGRLGAAELSAVGLSCQLIYMLVFFLGALGIATTAVVARRVGEGKTEEVPSLTGNALLASFVLGLAAVVALFWLAPQAFALANMGRQVDALGTSYMRVFGWGPLFMIPTFVGNGALRGLGNTRTPMLISAVIAVVNIAGDYVLIYGHWGFPALGAQGAAIAALVAVSTGFCLMLWSLRQYVRLSLRHVLSISPPALRSLFSLSVPAGLEALSLDGSRTIMSLLVANLGPVSFAALQVTTAGEALSFMPGFGFALATAVLVGQALGQGDQALALRTVKRATQLAVGVMCLIGLSFLFIPQRVVALFSNEAEVIAIAARTLRVAFFAMPLMGITETVAGALRGAGDTRGSFVNTSVGAWLVRVPFVYLATNVLGWGLTGVWVMVVLDWLVRSSLMLYRLWQGHWMRIRV